MTEGWRNKGFSLIELVIAVAVIAILASLAIPKFLDFACRSKMSEATSNLSRIKTAQYSFRASDDIFMECGPSPPDPAGSDGRPYPWVETPNGSGEMGFETIGFEPDGVVRYQYEVPTATLMRFVATAESDLDNDGVQCTLTLDNQAAGYPKPVKNPPGEL